MKIFKKLAYMSALAMLATGIAACSDDDDYTRAKPVPEDCMQVYFSELNESAYELAPDVLANTKIDLSVMRLQTADAASVPVKVYQTGDIFVVPATVEFAAGQATATLSVSFKEAATGEYSLRLAIEDEQYADPYKVVEGSPIFSINLNVVKWNLLGTGTYTYNSVWSGSQSEMELYQRDGTTEYKFTEWGGDIELFFNCDESGNITVAQQYTGANHPTYGQVFVSTANATAPSRYDAATKTYYFNCRYFVSTGASFVSGTETYVLTNPAQ